MEVKILQVAGFEPAIKGMRNPLNSWKQSDSKTETTFDEGGWEAEEFKVGSNDMKLMQKLFSAGSEHRKYDRMINVYMDITASHVFWSEFDTYKVGTVRNSCSKMHRIHVKPFTIDDFTHEGIDEVGQFLIAYFERYVDQLEVLRIKFNSTHEKKYWKALLEMLPMGFKLTATVMFNYETAWNIYHQRKNHKWYEWKTLCDAIAGLPYFAEITGLKEGEVSDGT